MKMQIETTLQSDPEIVVVVTFRYIPPQLQEKDCPPAGAEIEIYSVMHNALNIHTSLKAQDLEALEIECFDYVAALKVEKEMYDAAY